MDANTALLVVAVLRIVVVAGTIAGGVYLAQQGHDRLAGFAFLLAAGMTMFSKITFDCVH